MSKTIIVSNRLPVRIEKSGSQYEFKSSEGGLATGLGSIYKEGNNIWIGWPGASFKDNKIKEEITAGLKKESMKPVFLTDQEVEEYYLGFSNQTLWPAYHYFVQYIQYNEKHWKAYQKVNRKFARVISENIEPGDIVWLHDYQLLLVAQMLREDHPDITIGFFQHIPFPSYEVFRMIPWRRELLRGMLGADFLGFHTYDDMRHFLSSVHRLVGYNYNRNEIQMEDRLVVVDSLPMGIDYDKFADNVTTEATEERVKRYSESLGKQRLILSMDRLDYSKGIPRRLKAFELFLEDNPDYHEKVSLLLIVVPSRDEVPSYQQLKENVDELVGKINSKYGRIAWSPIHYFYRSYPFDALSAFYRMCDVAMITPMRDGMNLVCKEYIASRHEKDGVLILSEMAGSAKELSDALLVNPNDIPGMAKTLKRALDMPKDEQKRHIEVMQESVKKYNIFSWVELFISNLERVKQKQRLLATHLLTENESTELTDTYKKSEKRLLFLDYDGTLVPFHNDPLACKPDDELLLILTKLAADPRNTVTVISGRKADTLGEWLEGLGIQLVAEHGIWTKSAGNEWQLNEEMASDEWKEEARNIINFYVDRTPGSFLEEKRHALVWHYRKVEKGLGELRSSELGSHLKHFMEQKQLQVLYGNHVVEVKPNAVNKGKVALARYQKIKPDFTLALGDDRTDEDIFEMLPASAYTIRIGRGASHARFTLDDPTEVRKLLRSLIEATGR
ncbi:MAG TPA: bifunctional alpha,alpha-trehalose-phosphate synthase (UDP-forming)/trehalose-phosphatase [Cryomorphaceae bacterium]|nr:bifunctional alpha,alpha-trehalose-phosphate synthase (UDP-forming)/trehalose-phosphatase [Cryomorphaceae bacterium]